MKPKFILIAACIVALTAIATIVAWPPIHRGPDNSFLAENAQPLSIKEYRAAISKFTSLVINRDPQAALDAFRREIKDDPRLARDCHSIVHEIGHAAFEKYNDFETAMQYQNEICNSGYMHGVIEGYLNSTSADIAKTAKSLCAPHASDTVAAVVQCYHGLGHAFMYSTSNDLPRAIALCRSFDNAFFAHTCTGGAFMENFNTDTQKTGHTTKYENASDPFYPCPEENAEDKPSCYTYAPTYFLSLHNDNFADAFAWCLGAERSYMTQCAGGVGYRAMNENIDNPMLVEKICDIPSVAMGKPCIFAATIVYIDHSGSTGPAKDLCSKLEEWNRPECSRAIYYMDILLSTPSIQPVSQTRL